MQYWKVFFDQSFELLGVILFACCNSESEGLFLPGTDAGVSAVVFQVDAHSPAVGAAWACRARSDPGDRRSALAVQVSRTLLRPASTSAEITPMLLKSCLRSRGVWPRQMGALDSIQPADHIFLSRQMKDVCRWELVTHNEYALRTLNRFSWPSPSALKKAWWGNVLPRSLVIAFS